MNEELKSQLDSQHPTLAKQAVCIIRDLNNIDGFEVQSIFPWKTNLPKILPTIGSRMESEIEQALNGTKILIQDQKMRQNYKI
jgi:hypothetical protein